MTEAELKAYPIGREYLYGRQRFREEQSTDLVKSYHKRYQASLMENSEFVQQYGLERFMEEQKEKYTCRKCGGVISLHDRECSECREKLKG